MLHPDFSVGYPPRVPKQIRTPFDCPGQPRNRTSDMRSAKERLESSLVSYISYTLIHTVDGRTPAPVDRFIGLSHYVQGFTHPRWLFGISSINSM